MKTIQSKELGIKGISTIEKGLNDGHELAISVNEQEKFIVMDMEQYNYLKECELKAEWHQAREEYKANEDITEPPRVTTQFLRNEMINNKYWSLL